MRIQLVEEKLSCTFYLPNSDPCIHEEVGQNYLMVNEVDENEANSIPYYGLWGGYSLIWVLQVRATGQGMVFWPCCAKQGIQFDLPLS